MTFRSSGQDASSRKHDAQRGIDATKNRLRASLSSAITDLKVQEQTTVQSEDDHLGIFE